MSIFKKVKEANQELERIEQEVKQLRTEKLSIRDDIENLKKAYLKAQEQNNFDISKLHCAEIGYEALEAIGCNIYIPTMIDDDIETAICNKQDELARLTGGKDLVTYTREYRIDGSLLKGRKFQENYAKNLLIGFNSYVQTKTNKPSATTFCKNSELIKKCFDKYNQQGELIGIKINKQYLETQLSLYKLGVELKAQKDREKERLKEEKRQMCEQEKLLEDIAKEKLKIEQERKALDVAFAKALSESERREIKAEMAALDKRLTDIDWRIEHPKSGWVYLITSPSLPGMYKCGVSRRLSGPQERVKELSSSALPWAFELKAYCFSDDAFEIESSMHDFFDKDRVAPNREFFYGDVKNAIDTLRNVFKQDVHYGTYDEQGDE